MSEVEKPPYTIPTMAEIAERSGSSGRVVVSTFSGAGGACLGLRWAGFRVAWASEFVDAAAEVYRLNHPDSILSTADIRTVSAEQILDEVGLAPGELDVFEGSPPCASFSMSGKRDRGWGDESKYSDTSQRTDDLFFEYARLLRGLQPRVFIAENVPGLVRGRAVGYFKEILAELVSCGYRVDARILDAQWLGVPQRRRRLIFVGTRNDLYINPPYPKPLPYRYVLEDALPYLRGVETHKKFIPATEPSPTVLTHGNRHTFSQICPVDNEASLERYAIFGEWMKLAQGEGSDRYHNLVRSKSSDPSPTITARGGAAGAAGPTHPVEPRKFYIGELRRICGFPDDFQLVGRYAQQWERLGRAVPPPVYMHVGRAVLDMLKEV